MFKTLPTQSNKKEKEGNQQCQQKLKSVTTAYALTQPTLAEANIAVKLARRQQRDFAKDNWIIQQIKSHNTTKEIVHDSRNKHNNKYQHQHQH
ncbi:hypothetical protein J2X66_000368 [Pseudomonas sp. 3296]|uniref:hypothetical protein n=1 Tax=Pseudomonas sp. 3296 TaxID=2817753 RepID=UPI00285DBCF6|nr:hypothetical protein [Pseudomonas sp. 3296]MDR6913521.1 hypothetical protein [Pseudomonas sp. 3296]